MKELRLFVHARAASTLSRCRPRTSWMGLSYPATPSPLAKTISPPPRLNRSPSSQRASSTSSHTTPLPHSRLPRLLLLLAAGAASISGLTWYLLQPATTKQKTLNTTNFVPYTVVSKTPVSPNSFVMTLAPRDAVPNPSSALPYLGPDGAWWDFQWSVQVKQPQIQIQREYTPLPPPPDQPRSDADDGHIRLFVRRLPRGEVSNYLAKMNAGDTVELRLGERGYAFAHAGADTPEDVVCLAGGTGIATAMQVAHAVLGGNPARGRGVHPDTKVRIVWAVRTRSDLQSVRDPAKLAVLDGAVADLPGASDMARRLLEMKRHYGDKLSVQVAIDDEGTALSEADLKNALQISPRAWARRPARRPLYPCALPVPVAVLCEPEDPTAHTATTTAVAAAALETNHAPAADLHKPVFVCGPQGFVDKLAGEVVRHPSGATFRTGGLLGELDAKFGDPARPWLVLGFP